MAAITTNRIDEIRSTALTDKPDAEVKILELYYDLYEKTNPYGIHTESPFQAASIVNGQFVTKSMVPKNAETELIFKIEDDVSKRLKEDLLQAGKK